MADVAGAVLAVVMVGLSLAIILRPAPRWVDQMPDKHRHLPGRPCYPCIARLERECGIGDPSPPRPGSANGFADAIRDALVAKGDYSEPESG